MVQSKQGRKTIANYIKNQELEDQLKDKRSLKE